MSLDDISFDDKDLNECKKNAIGKDFSFEDIKKNKINYYTDGAIINSIGYWGFIIFENENVVKKYSNFEAADDGPGKYEIKAVNSALESACFEPLDSLIMINADYLLIKDAHGGLIEKWNDSGWNISHSKEWEAFYYLCGLLKNRVIINHVDSKSRVNKKMHDLLHKKWI